MSIKDLTQTVKEFIFELFGKDSDVISAIPVEKGWMVTAEVLMDEDYTIKRGRSDLLYVFEILVDTNLHVLSYSRTRIRERGKIDE
jgi:hypothetical protein